MGRKSVAVLDVRSSEISIVVGERGVNNTFVYDAHGAGALEHAARAPRPARTWD